MDINTESHFRYGSLRFFAAYVPFFLKRLYTNFKIQRDLFSRIPFDDVIFDSDYSFVLHRLMLAKPRMIGLNNSIEVLNFFAEFPRELNSKLFASFVIEATDYFVHRLFTAVTLCPSLDCQKLRSSGRLPKNFFPYTTVIRKDLMALPAADDGSVLIMSSSSNVETELSHVSQRLESFRCVSLISNFTRDNSNLLNRAHLVLCNAGQSSLSECLYLKKRCIVAPIPRHAEQFANSRLVQSCGPVVFESGDLTEIVRRVFAMPAPPYQMSPENAEAELNELIEDLFSK